MNNMSVRNIHFLVEMAVILIVIAESVIYLMKKVNKRRQIKNVVVVCRNSLGGIINNSLLN